MEMCKLYILFHFISAFPFQLATPDNNFRFRQHTMAWGVVAVALLTRLTACEARASDAPQGPRQPVAGDGGIQLLTSGAEGVLGWSASGASELQHSIRLTTTI